MTPARDRLLAWTLTACLAALPLGWIHLGALGGFDLRLSYGMALLLGAVLVAMPGRLAFALRHLPQWCAAWLALYVLYLLVLALKLADLPGNGIMVRQVFFLICALAVGGAIVALRGDPAALRRGGLLGVVGFVALTETVARAHGLSWAIAVERFVLGGDLNFVIYGFLRELFRIAGPDGAEVAAAEKNIVAVALMTSVLLFRAAYSGPGTDWPGRMVTVIAVGLLLLLNTRSVLLVLGLALVVAMGLGASRERQSMAGLIGKGLVGLGAAVAALLVLTADPAALSIIGNRFAFDDASSSGRLAQLLFAVERIEESILFGSGLAEINGQLVHNLFLGAWMHAGLPAFLLVAGAYAVMLWTWVTFVARSLAWRGYWVLPLRLEWVAVLPALFFLRVWVAGDAGHPGFADWIGFVCFQALVIANGIARRGETTARRADRMLAVTP